MIEVAHFYHCWCDGDWRNAVAEHLAALEDGSFDGALYLGLSGAPENRAEALHEFTILEPPTEIIEADAGWEQLTLSKAHEYAQTHDGAVLYGHTKGAHSASPFQEVWRQWMTWNVVVHWRDCADALEERGVDAIGCHWLTRDEFPHVEVDTDFPMFGGNFWIATCQYLRTLPPVGTNRRHEAESWIGLGDPKVFDLSPGWPGAWPYPHRPARRLIVGR